MEKQRVRDLLAQLHDELSSSGDLDDATAQRLRAAVDEIEQTLATAGEGGSQPLVQRLRDAVYHLPDHHPAVQNTIGRIADALAQMGI